VASRSMSCSFEVVCFMDEEYRPVGLVSTVRSVGHGLRHVRSIYSMD
jgi:hypothetical protein